MVQAPVKAALLLAALLAGCAPREMTADEAIAAANGEVDRLLPQFDRSRRTIHANDADGKWSVTYASPDDLHAGGPLIVQVDKRTRRAAITQMAR
jgi:hypothetical protein